MVEPDRPQKTIKRMRFTCWTTKTSHTLRTCNTYCLPTATLATRRRLYVTSHVHCLSCHILNCRFSHRKSEG